MYVCQHRISVPLVIIQNGKSLGRFKKKNETFSMEQNVWFNLFFTILVYKIQSDQFLLINYMQIKFINKRWEEKEKTINFNFCFGIYTAF
jgi:hypothetical protein